MYIIDDYREAYSWLRTNTEEDSAILSWWDYGYQIAGMADRATVVDNNTWNNTHIALIGKFMASDEKKAHALATQLGLFCFEYLGNTILRVTVTNTLCFFVMLMQSD